MHVLLEHARAVQAGAADQLADAHEGGDAVLGGGRVHHDEAAAVRAGDAEVAARAGVGRGQVQRGAVEAVARGEFVEPAAEGARALGVGPGDRRLRGGRAAVPGRESVIGEVSSARRRRGGAPARLRKARDFRATRHDRPTQGGSTVVDNRHSNNPPASQAARVPAGRRRRVDSLSAARGADPVSAPGAPATPAPLSSRVAFSPAASPSPPSVRPGAACRRGGAVRVRGRRGRADAARACAPRRRRSRPEPAAARTCRRRRSR